MQGPFVTLAVTPAAPFPPRHIQHGHVLQGLQLPAQIPSSPSLQKPHDLRGDLRGDWVGHWVVDWVGTPLLGTLLIVFLPRWPFAQGTQNALSTRPASPALLPRRASRDSLNLSRESRGSITRGSTCSGSAWDGLPRRPGGDACLPRTRGSCRQRTSTANRPRPPRCGWRSGPGTSGRAR